MHSLTTLKRRPAVAWLALALVTTPVMSSAAATFSASISGKGELRTVCPADGSALVPGQIVLVDDGTALRIVAVDSSMSADCAMKATAANLKVRFPGNTQDILLTGPVAYNVLSREVGFGIVEPALCESFYPIDSAPLLQIALTDPDGSTQTLTGISGLEYALPSTARFTPTSAGATYGSWVQCHAIPYSTLVDNAPDVPAPGVNIDPGNPDLIFADGMETPESKADLRIEILDDGERYLTRNIQAYIDQPFQYVVRIRNVGSATATGVRLREFTPDASVLNPPVPMQPRVTIGAWSCENELEQSCGIGSGELDVANITLAAGGYRDYTVTREVVTADVDDKVAISTALFYAPNDEVSKGDVSNEDNVASAIVTLLENTGPVITCIDPQIGSGPNALPNPLNMQEDDGVREFECTMTDAEQDAITSFTANSSNVSLIPNDGLLGPRAGDTWELFVAPQPEAAGSSTVTLTATDARGAQRVMQFTVEVAAVNDAPTFSLFSTTVVQSATGDVPTDITGNPLEGALQFPTMEANCFDSGNTACTVSISSFAEDVISGPSNESAQLVQPVTLLAGDCVLANGTGSLSNLFAVLPQLTPASAQASGSDFALAWTYRKNAPATLAFTCTVRVQDSGGAQASGQITFSMGN